MIDERSMLATDGTLLGTLRELSNPESGPAGGECRPEIEAKGHDFDSWLAGWKAAWKVVNHEAALALSNASGDSDSKAKNGASQ